MRKILGAITHQPSTTTTTTSIPRENNKAKSPMKSVYKERQASTSPNGGFFSHPAFKNRASPVPKRTKERASPRAKAALLNGPRKRIERREKTCNKALKKERIIVSDDEHVGIASSSGPHPSSDVHDAFADAPMGRQLKFADVVDTLPPSSPPLFAQDQEDEGVMPMELSSSPGMPSQGSSSPMQNIVRAPTTRQTATSLHTPPRHQKPRISARTLAPTDALPALKITYTGTYPLVLGRSRRLAPALDVASSEIVPVPMALTADTAQHLIQGHHPQDGKLAPLPRTASHASRAHVLVQVVPATDAEGEQIQFTVLGQNGCKIRCGAAERGERYAAGGVARFGRTARGQTPLGIEVDMYSCRALIEWRHPVEVEEDIPPSPTIDDDLVALVQTPSPAIPRRTAVPAESPSPARSIHSQMTYDNPSDDEAPPARASPSRDVKKERLDAAAESKSDAAGVVAAAAVVEATPRPPRDIDLKALVATSLVFSGTSAISAPDLVKSILDVSCTHTLSHEILPADSLAKVTAEYEDARPGIRLGRLGGRHVTLAPDVWPSRPQGQGTSCHSLSLNATTTLILARRRTPRASHSCRCSTTCRGRTTIVNVRPSWAG